MSLWNSVKSAFQSGARELSKEYGGSNDFLNACCSSCALVAWADGTLEDAEKAKIVEVTTTHGGLSSIYTKPDIERAIDAALRHGTTSSGRNELGRSLNKVAGNKQMAEDVFLVAYDVAGANSHANGGIGDVEQKTLDKIAGALGVNQKDVVQF